MILALMSLTFSTGLVDATSFLGLGRIFTANMTGNIVFIGFSLVEAPRLVFHGQVASLVAFDRPSLAAASSPDRRHRHRRWLLATALKPRCCLPPPSSRWNSLLPGLALGVLSPSSF
jgi:uncharacterized membrane protein YoaK (UPF0700 family)